MVDPGAVTCADFVSPFDRTDLSRLPRVALEQPGRSSNSGFLALRLARSACPIREHTTICLSRESTAHVKPERWAYFIGSL